MISMISVAELHTVASGDQGVVIDVRNADEFTSGHVPGARLIPLPTVPLRTSDFDHGDVHYIICESGARSFQASQYLTQQGFDVRNVEGGMSAWRAQGHPLETGMTPNLLT